MNQKNKIITVYGLWFADLLSIVLSFVLATYIRFHNFKDMEDKGNLQRLYSTKSLCFLVCSQLCIS